MSLEQIMLGYLMHVDVEKSLDVDLHALRYRR